MPPALAADAVTFADGRTPGLDWVNLTVDVGELVAVAGVDADSQRRFRGTLVPLVRQRTTAVLLISHELGVVADDRDRLVVLRAGKVAFDGTPADLTATGVSLGVHARDLPLWPA